MEEALSILWTYARRQPIESNGKTIVATISQSIAAIRIIMRLEGWLRKNEGRESEERRMISKERKTKPSENLKLGYVEEKNRVYESFAQPQLAHANENMQLVPTNDRARSASRWCELVARTPREQLTSTYTPQPLSLPYHEVLSRFAKVSYTMSKAHKPYHSNLRVQVAGLSIQATCNQQKKQRRNAACKVKESKSISPYEYSCAVSHKHSKAAALMLDKNRIRPPCVALIINGINH